jgi:NAD(P)-dependent dehydrogenase (short-subunit alcohol dehydrogenase family)
MLLKDKIVIVSGIGPGLGVKLAVEAAREGAAGVVCAARNAGKLDDAEARIRALGVKCEVLKQVTDITDRAACERTVAATLQRFGRIDVLLNSAYDAGPMDNASTAAVGGWLEGPLKTNVIGTLQLTQAVVPQMKQQRGGAIVMINTMAVHLVPPGGGAGYAASKGALAVAVKYLAQELGRDNIRVNSVFMGWMWGAPVQDYVQKSAAQMNIPEDKLKSKIAAGIPLGRIPTDDECARAALMLASDYASAVTGASLDANGGAWMP